MNPQKGEPFPFDPGVLVDEDGRVWLYSGFATKVPAPASRWHDLTNEGGVVLELEPDMVTVKAGPKLLFPTKDKLRELIRTGKADHKQKSFLGHAFFEASSIRKVDDRYCFVYSSQHNHELCYAMSDRADGDFVFGGTLVDLGDLYMDGNENERQALNYLGNTHGGMCCIGGEWYIFYHRQTDRSSYARQACAERLIRRPDGGFRQAEVTSCGLNGGPLKGKGTYEARIACNLRSREGTGRYDCRNPRKVFAAHPYFTQTGRDREKDGDQYIANIQGGAEAGFKYFAFEDNQMDYLDAVSTSSDPEDIPEFKNIYFERCICSDESPGTVVRGLEGCHGTVHDVYFKDCRVGSSGHGQQTSGRI